MEKHPIDDLFARKLSGVNREPSKEVWERLQRERKMETRSVFFRYRWLAAAMVAMLLFTVSVRYVGQMDDSTQVAGLRTKEKHIEKPKEQVVNSVRKSQLNQPQAEQIFRKVKQSVSTRKVVAVADGEEGTSKTLKKSKDENGFQIDPINAEPPTTETATDLAVRDEPLNESSLIPKAEENRVEVEGKAQKEINRVVVVHVVVDKEDATRPNRFKRMLKQLQNAKEGEKVDWEEMGINTKKIFAHAGNE